MKQTNKKINKGEWHKHQESFFNEKVNKISYYIPDSVISTGKNKFAFEFQDKHVLTHEYIYKKNNAYIKHNYNPIWIIRIDEYAVIENNNLRYNKSDIKIYEKCQYLYLSYNKLIFHPNKLSKCLPENDFYNIFINKNSIPVEDNFIDDIPGVQLNNSLFNYIQMGAGSGKTYSIMIDALQNDNITIILTKVNIAKDAIFNKIHEILKENEEIIVNGFKMKIQDINNILHTNKNLLNTKQYIVEYKDKIIIIATVDSFLYNFIDDDSKKQLSQQLDTFKYVTQNFQEVERINHIYKGKNIDGATVYIDEAQDLHKSYKNFIEQTTKRYNFKIILVGDILQSIYYDDNLYKCVSIDTKWKRIKENEEYICRRCKNYEIINFVNENIHNKIQNNDNIPIKQPIQKYYNCLNIPNNKNNIQIYKCEIYTNNNIIIDMKEDLYKTITNILEIHKNKQPKSFAFILPYIKHYSISSYIEKILIEKLGSSNVHLFQAENGEPINLNKYSECAKILSVHSSKGEGFDVVVSINIEPKIISKVYQHDNNINSLLCWSMMNVAYTRAKENLYVINFDESNTFFRWKSFTSTKNFVQDCINEEQQNKLINIIKKSLGNDYDKLFDKIDKNVNGTLIDNNIQSLRYYIIMSLLYLISYMNTNGKNEYIAKLYHNVHNKNVKYCDKSIEFKYLCNKYNQSKYDPINKYNYQIPIFLMDHYNNANKIIKECIEMILNWNNQNRLSEYIVKLYNYIQSNLSKILQNKIDNIDDEQYNIYKLIFMFILMKLQDNPYMTYDFHTFCEIVENIDNKNFINEIKYLCNSFRSITNNIPFMKYIGLSSSFRFNRLFKHNFFIVSKKYKNSVNQQNSEDKLQKYILLNEYDNYIISDPLNQPLSTLNFSFCCIKSLIEYILLINTNPNYQKEILIYTTSENDTKRVLEYNFINRLSEEDINEVKNIINEALYNMNKSITDDVIKWCNKSINNPKELIERLKLYNKKYKDKSVGDKMSTDFKNIFKAVIEKYNKKERTYDELISIITKLLNERLQKLLIIKSYEENIINKTINDDLFD